MWNPKESKTFQNFLLILSIYVVVELYISSITNYTELTKEIVEWLDFIICLFFLYDFFAGLRFAKNKWYYLKNNWIDFVSSIPMVGALRAGRIVKIIRILRVVRSARFFFRMFINRKNSFATLRNMVLLSIMIILLFALSFFHLESNANDRIHTFEDSLWWTTITTITVGFLQDIPPVTVEGKILSIMLIIIGMIIFSTLIGTVTDYFIEDEDIQDSIVQLDIRINGLENKLDNINHKLDVIINNNNSSKEI